MKEFNLDVDKLRHFLFRVSQHYNLAPFHNMTHAFNVSHMCFWIITAEESDVDANYLSQIFTPLDKLIMLISCIGHDLDHPGLGNTYFVKAGHMIAQTVNNQSVLEHFHALTLFKLLDES